MTKEKKDLGINKKIKKESPEKKTGLGEADKLFPIIGIGASAGGLEALELFFQKVPSDCNAAFVVIQHLDPTKKGMMPELLQRFTPLKVVAATDRQKVKPNCVFVLPPNKNISLLHRTLYLFEPQEPRGLRYPIDFFFFSLAEDLQERSIGIILSGMGSDGSLGLSAIKEKSGLALVQDPLSSKFDSMPHSAINAVTVDFIAPVEQLPDLLFSYVNNRPSLGPVTELPLKDKSALEKIFILLRLQTGHDFSCYKSTTLNRRIERRMGIHRIKKLVDYVRFLQENPKELEILLKDLLIGVTHFFRDAPVWDKLKRSVLPDLFENLPNGHTLRVWVPGCSTGEEAYSLAMIFKEVLGKSRKPRNLSFQIFATDLDQEAIEKARKADFPSYIAKDVDRARLNRFFIKTDSGYRIKTELRETVVFAPQNVIQDTPFTKLDFISCRNMLIYLDSELQLRLLGLFHYCLNPDGLLLLGTSESLGMQSSLFSSVDEKLKIFRRAQKVGTAEQIDFPTSFSYNNPYKIEKIPIPEFPNSLQTLADQLLLEHFAPPAAMTNDKGDIVYITGHTAGYLELAVGKASMNIFSMAREGLRSKLTVAFAKAAKSYERIVLRNIRFDSVTGTRLSDVTVQRIKGPEALRGFFMVVFSEACERPGSNPEKAEEKDAAEDSTIRMFEDELRFTKEKLRLTVEEMQTSQEELKSANEELQSTNEELTTSKEEMQSLNEELQTVNLELQNKVNDYIHIMNDFINLLDSTDIATLFLDKDLNIRRFTKLATQLFKLMTVDVGRPVTDIVTDLAYPDFVEDMREVLRSLRYIEKGVTTHDGRWVSVRIMPYRTIDDRIDGLVITFTDISQTKKLEFDLRKTNEILDVKLKEVQNLLIDKGLILKEVHHRIKNNLNSIMSLLRMQADAHEDETTKSILQDATGRVQSMMVLYDKLYRSEDCSAVAIKDFLPVLIKEIVDIFPKKASIEIETELEDIVLSVKTLSPLGIILNELVTNAMKYAFLSRKTGIITVTATRKENRICITFGDNGTGISQNVTLEKSSGFGLQLVGMLIKNINGSVRIEREPGTKFFLEFEV